MAAAPTPWGDQVCPEWTWFISYGELKKEKWSFQWKGKLRQAVLKKNKTAKVFNREEM